MICKRGPTAHVLSSVSRLTMIFAILIVLAAPAQLDGRGQTSDASGPLFLPVVAYDPGAPNTIAVAIADVNGDRKPDLVVTNRCAETNCASSSVGVLLGGVDGTFHPVMIYGQVGSSAVALAVADVNNDGKPDVAVANFLASTVTIVLGNGDGTFRPGATYDSGGIFAHTVNFADVNGDGKADMLVGNGAGNFANGNPTTRTVSVLLGNGDGSFQPGIAYDSGASDLSSVAVTDVNRDKVPDLIVASRCGGGNCANQGSVAVLLGNGDGTLQDPVTYSSGGYVTGSVAVADVNGDGVLDATVANCTSIGPPPGVGSATCPNGDGVIGVLLGNGDGTFQSARTYDSGGEGASSLVVADFNGDFKADVAVLTNIQSKTLALLLGKGDGTFQLPTAYNSGGLFSAWIAVGDLNGDRRPDLAVANESRSVGVLLNKAAPRDVTPPMILLPAFPRILSPPTRKLVPVMVFGTITDAGSGVNLRTATYAVKDEYGEVQPKGHISLDNAGNYRFTVLLQASRRFADLNGRQYMITVRAKDNAGNAASKTGAIIVPHG